MSEQVKNTFLAIAVGIITGVGLLVGIATVVTNALVPLTVRGQVLAESTARMERQLTQRIDTMDSKIDALDKKLDTVRLAGGNMQRPPMPSMPTQPPPEDNTVYEIPVGDSYVLGNPNAPVTIV